MSAKFSHTMEITIGATEVTVEFAFTCSPGCPEQGPSYASGGEPAENPELEIISATAIFTDAKGKITSREVLPLWLENILASDEYVTETLGESCDWGAKTRDAA